MARSRPPGRKTVASEIVAELRAEREAAFAAFREHAAHCYLCHGSNVTGQFCDIGWPLAKARARAIYNADYPDAEIKARSATQERLF